MKRWKGLLLACLLCAAACGGANSANQNMAMRSALLPLDTKPEYELTPLVEEKRYTAEDGTFLAECRYELPRLSVGNEEELSEDTAQQARQTVERFNERMDRRLRDAEAFGQELRDMAEDAHEAGFFTLAYTVELSASAARQGRLCSIRLEDYSYSGGAHPNSYTDSYLFDLELGQFIDPAQVADDPVAFQQGAAELLLEKAREQDADVQAGFYPEYAETITHWYEGTVLFDGEGMTVVYSPYELGPYALGTVELRADYRELAELLGPGGLERLGLTAAERE